MDLVEIEEFVRVSVLRFSQRYMRDLDKNYFRGLGSLDGDVCPVSL